MGNSFRNGDLAGVGGWGGGWRAQCVADWTLFVDILSMSMFMSMSLPASLCVLSRRRS